MLKPLQLQLLTRLERFYGFKLYLKKHSSSDRICRESRNKQANEEFIRFALPGYTCHIPFTQYLPPTSPCAGGERHIQTSSVTTLILLSDLPRNLEPQFHPERPAGMTILMTLDYKKNKNYIENEPDQSIG